MNGPSPAWTGGSFIIWRVLLRSQLREHPARLFVTVLAIALGVALGAAEPLLAEPLSTSGAAAADETTLDSAALTHQSDNFVLNETCIGMVAKPDLN